MIAIILLVTLVMAVLCTAILYLIPKVVKLYIRVWVSEDKLDDNVIEGILIAFGLLLSAFWAIYDIYHL